MEMVPEMHSKCYFILLLKIIIVPIAPEKGWFWSDLPLAGSD